MVDGMPQVAVANLKRKDVSAEMRFSRSKSLQDYAVNRNLLNALEEQLRELRMARQSMFRLYHQDSKRDNKITVLSCIIEAYKVGNLDVLHYFNRSAMQRDAPFIDEKTANTWDSRREGGSRTVQLVEAAFNDALDKILKMNAQGCGVMETGENIINAREYVKKISRR